MEKISIRKACLMDAQAIAKVHVDSWREIYCKTVDSDYLNHLTYERSEQLWDNVIRSAIETDVVVAEDKQEGVVGFAAADVLRGQKKPYEAELVALYIRQNYRGHGLGRQLVFDLMEILAERGIYSLMTWVFADNLDRQFYVAMQGEAIEEKSVLMNGKELPFIAYGWRDTRTSMRTMDKK